MLQTYSTIAFVVTFFKTLGTVHGIPLAPKKVLAQNDSPPGQKQATSSTTFIVAGSIVGLCCLGVAAVLIWQIRKHRTTSAATATSRATGTMAQAEAILAGGTSAINLVSNSEGGSSRAQSSAETGGSRRQRRARRAHRTPSQISTKSLPAYKEEPGDEELVLVRRITEAEEAEDASSTLDPQSSISSGDGLHARTLSSSSSTIPVRTPDGHMRRPSSTSNALRGSMDSRVESSDTHDSAGSGDRLLENHNHPTIPLVHDGEEAPPYFEFQEHLPQGTSQTTGHVTGSASEIAVSISPPTSLTIGRGLPNPLRRFFSRGLNHSEGTTENRPRATTNPILASSTLPGPAGSSLSRNRSHSRPGSLGSNLTRPLTDDSSLSGHSRNRSGSSLHPSSINRSNPNSSQISVGSLNISAPLTHTTTRTEFTFPKAGPTAEQLKFVSSRESLGRFGIPYGSLAKEAYPSRRPPPFESPEPVPSSSYRSLAAPANWWRKLTQPASEFSTPEVPDNDRVASGSEEPKDETQPNGGESERQNVHEMAEIRHAPGSSSEPTSIPLPLSRGGTLSSVRSSGSYTTAQVGVADIDVRTPRASSPMPSDANEDTNSDTRTASRLSSVAQLSPPSRRTSIRPARVSLASSESELRDVGEGELFSSSFLSVPLTPVSVNGGAG